MYPTPQPAPAPRPSKADGADLAEYCGPAGGIIAAGFVGGILTLSKTGGMGMQPAQSFVVLFGAGIVGGVVLGRLVEFGVRRRDARAGRTTFHPRRFLIRAFIALVLAWATSFVLSASTALMFVSPAIAILLLAVSLGASGWFVASATLQIGSCLQGIPREVRSAEGTSSFMAGAGESLDFPRSAMREPNG